MASDTQERNGGLNENMDNNTTKLSKDVSEESSASDNDGGERPVRRKLKETTIEEASKPSANISGNQSIEIDANSDNGSVGSRGRKKRSFDDLQTDNKDATAGSTDETGHRRKRSRDSKTEDDVDGDSKASGVQTPPEKPPNADDVAKQILSPKKKRSIDQLDNDAKNVAGKPEEAPGEKAPAEGEPERKRYRDSSQEKDATIKPGATSKTSLPAAFANTSAASPFASLASAKSDATKAEDSKVSHVTSSSAFASSKFASFAGSAQSPFGSLGASAQSVFEKKPSATESEKPAATGFAAAAGPSPFASSGTSGFGSGFSAFAAAAPLKPAGGLTSFAGGSSALGSTSKAKPFGAAEDEEEENEEEAEKQAVGEFEKEKEDERFFKQEVETGEEEETTYFSCKAKLFHFTDKEWKERGIGTFKVNVREPEEGKKTARMIMRADGVLRVMLNTPIFKGMVVGDPTGKEPTTKQINIASVENGRSVPLLLRTGSVDLAKELYHVVRDLQQHL
ncbi:hypothetical protein VTN02DRAFT_1 [Thermoascus thermophilus]